MEKRILIGLHNKDLAESARDLALVYGYQVTLAKDTTELLTEAKTQNYSVVHMDLNYGFPNSTNITVAIQVYDAVRPQLESGLVKFIGISGNGETVRLAKERGLPAESKGIVRLSQFL